jgi:hypothetical protein
MSKTIKKLSPFALGMALCAYPVVQMPGAQAASLALGSTPSAVEEPSTPGKSSLAADCLASALPPERVGTQEGTVGTPELDTSIGYQSSPDLAPATEASPRDATDPSGMDSTDPTLIAQLEPGCGLAGTPPVGGGALAGPLLAPLLAAPIGVGAVLLGNNGDDNNPPNRPPVPLSESSTAGIVAGFGLIGLWYSRRFR